MPVLETSRLLLNPVTVQDVADVHVLHSLPETDEFNTLGIPENIQVTRDVVDNWLAKENADPPASYTMTIRLRASGQFIGMIGMNLGPGSRSAAEIWYKLHKDHWRQGYASEAVQAILQFGFAGLGLHRISAGCATGNVGSIKVLEKAGMQREGHCRKILPIRGSWLDNYLYAILEEDFFRQKNTGDEPAGA